MRCLNCGSEEMVDPEAGAAEGGVKACARCSMAVAPDDDGEVTGGVAPMPTDAVPVVRPDTGETGQGEQVALPAKNAARADWDAIAPTFGLDPAEYSTREELIIAVEERQAAAPDTTLNAPDDAPPE